MRALGVRAPWVAWALAAPGLAILPVALVAERYVGGEVLWHDVVLAAAALVVGARIASRVPGNGYGWLLLAAGLLSAMAVAFSLATSGPALSVRAWASFPGYALLTLSGLYFPDGRLPSPRWRPVVLLLGCGLGYGVLGFIFVGARIPLELLSSEREVAPGWDVDAARIGVIALPVTMITALVCVVVRIRRADRADRGPLIWGAASAVLLVVGLLLQLVDAPLSGLLVALSFPAASVVMIVRYGWYDIETVVHRSLLYGTLAIALIGIYVGLATVSVRFVPAGSAPIVAAVVALSALPLRSWLQRLLDRWLYGQSGSPYELVTALADGVGTALTPADMLAAVVDGVARGLRVPYVAIVLEPNDQPERSAGSRRSWPLTSLELVHQGAVIGQLLVQQRAPDEAWMPRERRLLTALARQVSAPAAAVRLIRDLQHTRERLVTAREEERRRLRKDLHDGVGPVLSGARMQLRALGGAQDGDALRALEDDLSLAALELRRAIDDLRPPALDRGLGPALDGVVARHGQGGPRITASIDIQPEDKLPAAVEVALYRVLDEALANCVRHARASVVDVRLARGQSGLVLTVRDDGEGYHGPREGGVGAESMRQRCEELGGSLTIEAIAPHGTMVSAMLPCD